MDRTGIESLIAYWTMTLLAVEMPNVQVTLIELAYSILEVMPIFEAHPEWRLPAPVLLTWEEQRLWFQQDDTNTRQQTMSTKRHLRIMKERGPLVTS